ncbi:GIN domain-containing protein [Rubrivivax sp. RP6-9]|uniref:GIN domain-containing protein n=1 Tax=Rubrivivax sp. RP6-9 TaxID=3415750 RepID=UPI003CC553B4
MPSTTRRHCLALAAGAALPLQARAIDLQRFLPVTGSGRIVTQEPPVGSFGGVSVADALVVDIEQAQPPGLFLEGDDNLLPLLDLQVQDGVLRVRQRRPLKPTRLRIVARVWQLDSLAVSGSAVLRGDGLVAKTLQLRGGGSGVVKLQALTAERVVVQAGGSTVLRLAGRANELALDAGGSALVDGAALQVRRVEARLGGAAAAKVWAADRLSGNVAGSAVLRYRGDPQLALDSSGSGRIRKL